MESITLPSENPVKTDDVLAKPVAPTKPLLLTKLTKPQGRYIFTPISDNPVKTEVTYELSLEFGFPLPDLVRNTICGAIMRTAISAFKQQTETLSRPSRP